MSKLDILCGTKVMSYYHAGPDVIIGSQDTFFPGPDLRYNPIIFRPSTRLDDALLCLERAAQGKGYSIYMFPEEKKPYDVELEVYKVCTDAETLPLAMCICALRGSGVSESDIQEALKS